MAVFLRCAVLFGVALSHALPQTTSTAVPDGIPSCADNALAAALQSAGCDSNDVQASCFCSGSQLLPAITTSIQHDCSASDQAIITSFAAQLCTATDNSTDTPTISSTAVTATASASPLPSCIPAPTSTPQATGDISYDTAALSTFTSALSTETAVVSIWTTTRVSTRTHSSNYSGTLTYSTTGTTKPTGNATFTGGAMPECGVGGMSLFAMVPALVGLLALIGI